MKKGIETLTKKIFETKMMDDENSQIIFLCRIQYNSYLALRFVCTSANVVI